MRHGGFYPDRKLRLFRRGQGRFADRPVHETVQVNGATSTLNHALIHRAYPTLEGYIQHMNRYSSLGAEIAVAQGRGRFSLLNIVVNPLATFLYNYFLRLGTAGWPRGPAAAPLPLGLRQLEIRQGVGAVANSD